MHIEGSYEFEFERELVWDVLMDIDVLGSIIPGSKGLVMIGDNKYQSKLAVRVGPVNGKTIEKDCKASDKSYESEFN